MSRKFRARLAGAGLELKVGYAAGGATNNWLSLPGIKVGDVVVSSLQIQPPTATTGGTILADLTSQTVIPQDNIIAITNTDTTGTQVLVFWWSI